MSHDMDEIEKALEILSLPKLITREDIKKQYYFLAKKKHPDKGGDSIEMEKINDAYAVLMAYIETFRYTFDAEELSKQFPGAENAKKFRH